MATHWSSSHSQWWSALRYCAIPTLMKPVVDGSPWPWSDDGSPIDFFGESQRPFRANAWKRRREEVEKSAAAGGAPPKKFSKLHSLLSAHCAEFLVRLRRTVRWLNEHQAEALQEMCCNQKMRAADVLELDGAKTKW